MEDRQKLNDLLPILDTLSRQHPDDSVKEMATDLRTAIATHGHVLSEALRDASQQKLKAKREEIVPSHEIKLHGAVPESKKVKTDDKKKPLIEVISSQEESSMRHRDDKSKTNTDTESNTIPNLQPKSVPNTKVTEKDNDLINAAKESKEKSEVDVAFEELMDPLSKLERVYQTNSKTDIIVLILEV